MDASQFRQDFPEFADVTQYPNSAVDLWLSLGIKTLPADRWCDYLDVGLELFTAHNLALAAGNQLAAAVGGAPGQVKGPLTSKSVDKVSAGYDTGAITLQDGGLGLSNEMLGLVYGTYGLIAVLVGSLLGGIFVSRRGLPATLFTLCCAVNIPNVTFLLMSMYQPESLWVISAGVAIEKFFYGFGSVGFMIYLMQQLAPGKYSTTLTLSFMMAESVA